VKTYLNESEFAADWQIFVEGELRRSNDTNNKNLGGQQPRGSIDGDDDDTNSYEMNMEKIMAKFTSFSSSMSDKSKNDKDDEEEDEDTEINRKEDDEEPNEVEDKKTEDKEDETRHESPTKQIHPHHEEASDEENYLKPVPIDFKETEPLV
jgi:hypothetical protein